MTTIMSERVIPIWAAPCMAAFAIPIVDASRRLNRSEIVCWFLLLHPHSTIMVYLQVVQCL